MRIPYILLNPKYQRKKHSLVTLVPIGSPVLCINTHALSSKPTLIPSLRCFLYAVRTTTACFISPRRTLLPAAEAAAAAADAPVPELASVPSPRCFCTTTMMRSPSSR